MRTAAGETIVATAVEAGDLVLGDTISLRRLDVFQRHQVRMRKRSRRASQAAPTLARPAIETDG